MSPQNALENKPRGGHSPRKLSRAKLDELRAKGKCFNCRQIGHKQRNCPKLQSMKPPKQTVNTGSIRFAKMEKLVEQKEQANVYLRNITMTGSDPISDKLKEFKELKFKIHRLCKEAWGEDPLWYHEETHFNCKYGVDVDGQEFTIWNFVNGENWMFNRNELEKQDFDIMGIFAHPESNRAPTYVREGG